MPFVPNTPESLSAILSRADSRSPSSTCCGITNTGRPCNRELKSTPGSKPPSSGIIAIIAGSRVYFCDSHKDQAQNVALRHTASFARRRELIGRGSMDTFIEQVEVLVGGPCNATKTKLTAQTKGGKRKDDPFASVEKRPNAFTAEASPPSLPTGYQQIQEQKQRRKKPGLLRRLFCCCTTGGDEEYSMNTRRKRTETELRAAAAAVVEDSIARPARVHGKDKRVSKVLLETAPPTPPLPMMYPSRKHVPSAMAKNGKSIVGGLTIGHDRTHANRRSDDDDSDARIFDPSSGSNAFYSYIPQTLSQKAQIRLQQELSKPFSDGDEPGYIYIFWLTDSPLSPASTSGGTSTHAANALLKTAKATSFLPTGQKPRILLKIGRATNVQRRLHEWSSQCGYNLSLVRFYPHVSASSTHVSTPGGKGSGTSTPGLHAQVGKKVPNSHRIEHLIHLELRDSLENPEIQCDACGKTHKEWFSVEASRKGFMAIDETVKKWIDYGERSAMVTRPDAQAAPIIPKANATPSPAKEKVSTPNSNTSPKTKTEQGASVTPTPVAKRPALKTAPISGVRKPAAETGNSGKNQSLTPGSAGGRGKSPARSNKSGGSRSPARSTKSEGSRSPARSTKSGGSRPGSSNGKAKASPGGKKGDKWGGWKTYDENEGEDEYVPDSN